MKETKPSQSLRWWPLVGIVILTVACLIVIWVSDAQHRQERVIRTFTVLLLSFLLMLVWLVLFSRLAPKIRLAVLGVVALVVLASVGLFRIRGVSGDLVPLLEWRWAKHSPQIPLDTSGTMGETVPLSPHDYPQFLGPHRNAMIHGIDFAQDWSAHPPRLIWRQPIGAGWSAFAVAGDSAITQEQRGEEEMVVCYALKSGAVKWSHSHPTKYESTMAGIGPRATPTIVGDRVYTLGATGLLNCLDLNDGTRIWSKDILRDNDAEGAPWGVSGSPLILGELVVVSAGGRQGKSLVAYHQNTGERVWAGGHAPAGYSSPQITTLAGTPQILIFNSGSVAAHHPKTGTLLWEYPWAKTECVAQPVPLPNDRVLVSTGYGIGAKLLHITRDEQGGLHASLVWETPRLKAKFTNVVYRNGYIYGLDDGVLVCLDVATGERTWKRGRYGHGQLILIRGDTDASGVPNLLLIQAESGDVVLVEANPDKHVELGRFAALDGKTWNNPALAGQYLLVRNDREAVCYQLPVNLP